MITRFPVAPERWTPGWVNQLISQLTVYFGQTVAKDEETPRIVLRSPNGSLYDVTVSDAGALVVTATSKVRA